MALDLTPWEEDSPKLGLEPWQEQQQPEQQQGLLTRLGIGPQNWLNLADQINRNVMGGVLGAGQELQREAHNLPGIGQLVPKPEFEPGGSAAANVGQFAGAALPFMLGGPVTKVIGEAAPAIGRGLEATPAWLQRILGTGAVTGLTAEPGQGQTTGLTGAGLQTGLETLGGVGGKLVNAFRPQAHAEKILESLGLGKTEQENAKSLAKDVVNAYEKRREEGRALYKPVFQDERVLKSRIKPLQYNSLDSDLFKNYYTTPELNKLHERFLKSPTMDNAHKLQSDLARKIRLLENKQATKDISTLEDEQLVKLGNIREVLKSDIRNYLGSWSPKLGRQYDSATEFWKNFVIPYETNPKISKLSQEMKTNPENVFNIFKNPEPGVEQIVEELGPEAKNKIIYSKLAKTKTNLTPEKLHDAYSRLSSQGLDTYINPELEKQMDVLKRKMFAKKSGQIALGTLAGGGLGAELGGLGFELPGEVAGGLIGSGAGGGISYGLGRRQGRGAPQIGRPGLSQAFTPLMQAAIAQILNQGE